jgi:peptide/nickel transport system permease protein
MLQFMVRRILTLIVTMIALSMMVFALSEVVPLDPAVTILGRESTPQARAELRQSMGLNRPLPERYARWLVRFVQGDWSKSYRLGADIRPLVMRRLQNSLTLAVLALLMISPISLVLGILAGLFHARWPDRVISIGSLLTISLPDFVIGLLLIVLFSWYLKWLPGDSSLRGQDLNISVHWKKLVLPSVTAAFVLVGYLTRVTRISMISVMDSAYIRTAVLKGLPFRTVIVRHALRNALIAPIAVITTQIAWLVGGLIVIEQLFNYPGIGSLFASAARDNDLPMIEAASMITITLVVVSQIVADLLYTVLNPRIRFS